MSQCPEDQQFYEINSSNAKNCVSKCSSKKYYDLPGRLYECSNKTWGDCLYYRNDSSISNPQYICQSTCINDEEFYNGYECVKQCPETHKIEYINGGHVYCNSSINITSNSPMTWVTNCPKDFFILNTTSVYHPHKK